LDLSFFVGDVLLGVGLSFLPYIIRSWAPTPRGNLFLSKNIGENPHLSSPWLAFSCLWFKSWT